MLFKYIQVFVASAAIVSFASGCSTQANTGDPAAAPTAEASEDQAVEATKNEPGTHAVDADKDGKPEKWVTFDDEGRPVKTELDRDGDGGKDMVVEYSDNVPTRAGLLKDGEVPVWAYFKDGKVAAVEAGHPPPRDDAFISYEEAKNAKTRGDDELFGALLLLGAGLVVHDLLTTPSSGDCVNLKDYNASGRIIRIDSSDSTALVRITRERYSPWYSGSVHWFKLHELRQCN